MRAVPLVNTIVGLRFTVSEGRGADRVLVDEFPPPVRGKPFERFPEIRRHACRLVQDMGDRSNVDVGMGRGSECVDVDDPDWNRGCE